MWDLTWNHSSTPYCLYILIVKTCHSDIIKGIFVFYCIDLFAEIAILQIVYSLTATKKFFNKDLNFTVSNSILNKFNLRLLHLI